MARRRRSYPPRLEPEVMERSSGGATVSGATIGSRDGARVPGATGSGSSQPAVGSGSVITLCDGSQFAFTRLADIRTAEDA
jgi:hypothetical protein